MYISSHNFQSYETAKETQEKCELLAKLYAQPYIKSSKESNYQNLSFLHEKTEHEEASAWPQHDQKCGLR